ncbi:hypothetical protein [Nocardioides sp. GXZ039]|uniref:hypothetical protein n=1 Tax=Nocardioides sp. GXZ039 TaxID=3136018 RepID=UPI0030F4553E
MNHYGALAQRHWKMYRPSQYAQLSDPEAFFRELGEEIDGQVQSLRDQLTTAERPALNEMTDLERIGRLNAIRRQAEELTYADLVWPSTTNEDLDQELDDLRLEPISREEALRTVGAIEDEDGGVMPADRNHPLWKAWTASTQDSSTSTEREAFDSAYRAWLRETPGLLDLI